MLPFRLGRAAGGNIGFRNRESIFRWKGASWRCFYWVLFFIKFIPKSVNDPTSIAFCRLVFNDSLNNYPPSKPTYVYLLSVSADFTTNSPKLKPMQTPPANGRTTFNFVNWFIIPHPPPSVPGCWCISFGIFGTFPANQVHNTVVRRRRSRPLRRLALWSVAHFRSGTVKCRMWPKNL